ncbi:VWA domain-containing protein, partial [Treponema pallidum]
DRDKIISVVDSIVPNGRYTDIGRALDTVWEIQEKRKDNNRHKVLLLVTDLEHDAPLTSKYRGKQRSFQ